ncbi:MAG: hypothetical protein ACRDYZ_13745 [Acidimicrobiales bacterium]
MTRRHLRLALGALWLLDGALQLQPFMFGRGFAEQIIAPTAAGQPAFVAGPVHWSAALILAHPLALDLVFAAVQLAIGAGLLFRRTARAAVIASLGWAAGVWLLGEGLGGLAGGGATLLDGAPGAVALFGLLGLAAWPRLVADWSRAGTHRSPWRTGRPGRAVAALFAVPSDDERPGRWVPAAWAGLWALFALLRTLPGNDAAGALAGQLTGDAGSVPHWLFAAQRSIAAAVHHGGVASVAGLCALELAVGLLALRPGPVRIAAVGTGIALALLAWAVGQSFGQITSGMATDPNAGPLVALLGVTVLAARRRAVTVAGAGTAVVPTGRVRVA